MDPLTSALASQYQGAPPELEKMRTIGLIAALTGNKQLAGAGDALMGNVQQQQQYAMQAPHMQAQTAKLQQEVQAAGPQQALGGQTPSNYEMLTKRAATPKFAVNPVTGRIYNQRNGQSAPGSGDGPVAGLSGPALDQAAERFHISGELPPLGMGAAGSVVRRQIMNRTAELHPDANIAGNKASYHADSGSLAGLQKSADAIDAFEQTAGKNLDQFLAQAKGPIDTGSPLINRPLRTIDQKVLGSPDMAAFNVARQVAVNEIAKVLSNPGMGGVLSDSARHEVEGLIGPDATLKQIYAAAGILKQDMANRKQAMAEQIATVRGRIGPQPAATPTPAAAPSAEPKVRKFTRGQDGKLKEIP